MSRITLVGSGWLALPLASELERLGHHLALTTTQADKARELKTKGHKVEVYELGQQLATDSALLQADVLLLAITSKDVEAYQGLVEQLRQADSQHLLFISSTSVYLNNGQLQDESSLALNTDSALYQIEQLIRTLPSVTILRFAGLVGPDRHPGRFFRRTRVMNNPQAPVNLIHLDDCLGIIAAIIKQQAWNEVFNGCADTHPSKAEFYPAMAASLGLKPPEPANSISGSDKIISNQKVKLKLNYVFRYPDVMQMDF